MPGAAQGPRQKLGAARKFFRNLDRPSFGHFSDVMHEVMLKMEERNWINTEVMPA